MSYGETPGRVSALLFAGIVLAALAIMIETCSPPARSVAGSRGLRSGP
jgi:hypothetical protein